jgi:hypothetical protein
MAVKEAIGMVFGSMLELCVVKELKKTVCSIGYSVQSICYGNCTLQLINLVFQ